MSEAEDLDFASLSGRFQGIVTSGEDVFTFEIESEGHAAFLRTLGHLILAYVPENGLQDAVSYLHDAFQFHSENLLLFGDERLSLPPSVGELADPTRREAISLE